ncbi:MAG: hypothetical protein V7609_1854, partial [Verrucomicrobiota bacterium]
MSAGKLLKLLLLVFVHDFELGVDDVALIFPWAFFLRAGLRT